MPPIETPRTCARSMLRSVQQADGVVSHVVQAVGVVPRPFPEQAPRAGCRRPDAAGTARVTVVEADHAKPASDQRVEKAGRPGGEVLVPPGHQQQRRPVTGSVHAIAEPDTVREVHELVRVGWGVHRQVLDPFVPGPCGVPGEVQTLVGDVAEPEQLAVTVIVHRHQPGSRGSLSRQVSQGTLNVSGAEVEQRPGRHGGINDGAGAGVAVVVQVAQESAEVLAQEPDLEGPGRVGVPDGHGEVGNAAEHHAPIDDGLGRDDGSSLDAEPDAPDELQVEPGGGDDHVGVKLAAALEHDPRLGERRDAIGDHRGLSAADRLEQVPIRNDAQSLVPGLVRRVEVLVHRIAVGQLLRVDPTDEPPRRPRKAPAEPPGRLLHRDVLPPGQR